MGNRERRVVFYCSHCLYGPLSLVLDAYCPACGHCRDDYAKLEVIECQDHSSIARAKRVNDDDSFSSSETLVEGEGIWLERHVARDISPLKASDKASLIDEYLFRNDRPWSPDLVVYGVHVPLNGENPPLRQEDLQPGKRRITPASPQRRAEINRTRAAGACESCRLKKQRVCAEDFLCRSATSMLTRPSKCTHNPDGSDRIEQSVEYKPSEGSSNHVLNNNSGLIPCIDRSNSVLQTLPRVPKKRVREVEAIATNQGISRPSKCLRRPSLHQHHVNLDPLQTSDDSIGACQAGETASLGRAPLAPTEDCNWQVGIDESTNELIINPTPGAPGKVQSSYDVSALLPDTLQAEYGFDVQTPYDPRNLFDLFAGSSCHEDHDFNSSELLTETSRTTPGYSSSSGLTPASSNLSESKPGEATRIFQESLVPISVEECFSSRNPFPNSPLSPQTPLPKKLSKVPPSRPQIVHKPGPISECDFAELTLSGHSHGFKVSLESDMPESNIYGTLDVDLELVGFNSDGTLDGAFFDRAFGDGEV